MHTRNVSPEKMKEFEKLVYNPAFKIKEVIKIVKNPSNNSSYQNSNYRESIMGSKCINISYSTLPILSREVSSENNPSRQSESNLSRQPIIFNNTTTGPNFF